MNPQEMSSTPAQLVGKFSLAYGTGAYCAIVRRCVDRDGETIATGSFPPHLALHRSAAHFAFATIAEVLELLREPDCVAKDAVVPQHYTIGRWAASPVSAPETVSRVECAKEITHYVLEFVNPAPGMGPRYVYALQKSGKMDSHGSLLERAMRFKTASQAATAIHERFRAFILIKEGDLPHYVLTPTPVKVTPAQEGAPVFVPLDAQ